MTELFSRLLREEEGQAMMEYSLSLAFLISMVSGISAFFIVYLQKTLKRIYYTLLVPIL